MLAAVAWVAAWVDGWVDGRLSVIVIGEIVTMGQIHVCVCVAVTTLPQARSAPTRPAASVVAGHVHFEPPRRRRTRIWEQR